MSLRSANVGALTFGLRPPRRRAMRWTAGGLLVLSIWLVASAHRGLISPVPSQLLLDRRSRYLGEVPAGDDSFGYWAVPYVLPSRIARATIETEDRHFYDHPGVNLRSVVRAFLQDVRHLGRVSGASTLAMQVARMSPRSPGPSSTSSARRSRRSGSCMTSVTRRSCGST